MLAVFEIFQVFFDRTSFTQDDFPSRSLGTATVKFSGDPSFDPSGIPGIDQVDSSSVRTQHRFTATTHRIGKEKYACALEITPSLGHI